MCARSWPASDFDNPGGKPAPSDGVGDPDAAPSVNSPPWQLAEDPRISIWAEGAWVLMRDPKGHANHHRAYYWLHTPSGLPSWFLPELGLQDCVALMERQAHDAGASMAHVPEDEWLERYAAQFQAALLPLRVHAVLSEPKAHGGAPEANDHRRSSLLVLQAPNDSTTEEEVEELRYEAQGTGRAPCCMLTPSCFTWRGCACVFTSPEQLAKRREDALRLHAVELDADAAKSVYLSMPLRHPLALSGCALLMLSIATEQRELYWNQAQVGGTLVAALRCVVIGAEANSVGVGVCVCGDWGSEYAQCHTYHGPRPNLFRRRHHRHVPPCSGCPPDFRACMAQPCSCASMRDLLVRFHPPRALCLVLLAWAGGDRL